MIQKDKILHLTCSAVITFIVILIFFLLNCDYSIAALSGFFSGCSAGFTKEFADRLNPNNKWDWKDLLFDAIGIVIALILGLILYFI